MNIVNELNISFLSKSSNESFSRACVSAFVLCLDPTIGQLSDIKTAVSEAVTNCIVHAYPDTLGTIYINVKITDKNKVIISLWKTFIVINFVVYIFKNSFCGKVLFFLNIKKLSCL